MHTTLDFMRSKYPPKPVLQILIFTAAVSLICAFLSNFFSYFEIPPPQYYLSLSLQGLKNGYLWQPLTYLFIEEGGMGGISFGFLISLSLNMAVLWFIGSPICDLFGARAFYTFYFVCGLIAGAIGLLAMVAISSQGFLSGPAPCILALLVAWAMLSPETELLLFFLIPLQAKWLVLGILGASLLICISQFDLVHFFYYLGGAFSGYAYAVIAWDAGSPFKQLHPMDRIVRSIGIRCRRIFSKKSASGSGKIVDFKTGQIIPENDDEFMDRMLSKIARSGEKSLSSSEKKRMKSISERKMRENKRF